MNTKIIHFGEFIRWHRVKSNKTTEELGRQIGLTARRLIAIEAMAEPNVQHTTIAALATAFGYDPETFRDLWKTMPVPVTQRKVGPTTDEATRFAQACAAAGITPAEGQRRLRSWIVEQDQPTQMAALSFVPPHRKGFTDAVDHLQSPADEVAKRVGQQANAASGHAANQPAK